MRVESTTRSKFGLSIKRSPSPPLSSHTGRFFGDETETIFPWTHFWVPANQPIQLDRNIWGGDPEGCLADPNDQFLGKHGNAHLITSAAPTARVEINKLDSEYDGTTSPDVVAGCVLDVSI